MEATHSVWIFRSTGPRWSEIADFQPIFAHSASAITPTEKSSINTNRKSTMRFPMSLRWSSYVAPKPPRGGGSKTQNGRFPDKIALRLKKVCYKVSLCENCQQQSCKAFIGLTNCAEIIAGATPFIWNFGSNWPHWSEIADFRCIFARSASAVTPTKKSSINTNKKSTMRFPMSPRWTTTYVVPKPSSSSLSLLVKTIAHPAAGSLCDSRASYLITFRKREYQ